MALGKNIKKKSLIPEEAPAAPAVSKAASAPKAPKKTPAPKSVERQPEAPAVATPPAPLAAPAPRKPAETRLSKAEYERRVSLHQKFGEEIATLAAAQVHLIVFQVGEEFFAIEISKVREVVRTPAVTRIPNSPAYIAGMASIRGEAIVIMDLGKKLQVASATSAEMAFTLVVETEHYTIGILVANVPQSRIVDGDMIQPTQDSISQTTTDETYIKGLVRFPAELVFFLDIDELIEGDRLRARVVAE